MGWSASPFATAFERFIPPLYCAFIFYFLPLCTCRFFKSSFIHLKLSATYVTYLLNNLPSPRDSDKEFALSITALADCSGDLLIATSVECTNVGSN